MKKRTKAGTSKDAAAARRQRFVDAYITNGNNATQAAIAAGFSPHSAERQGLRLTSDDRIKGQLYERQQEVAKRFELSVERVMQELARIALQDPGKLFDADGKLKPVHLLDEDTRRAVASVKDGEVKMWDKVSALRTAHQILRPQTPSVAVQNNVSVAGAEVAGLDLEQRNMLDIGRRVAYTLHVTAKMTKETV